MGKIKSNTVLTGWLFGLTYFAFIFRWLWNAYPLKALGISSHIIAFFLILTAYLLTVFVSSLFWALAMGITVKVEKKISWTLLIVFPSVFVWFEYLRTLAMSVLWSGTGNGVSSHWTAGNLAYFFSNNNFALKFSSWFGVYGVLFSIIFVVVLTFLLFEKKYFKKLIVLLAVIVVLSYFPYDRLTTTKEGEIVKVAVIQTDTPSQETYTSQEQLSFFKKQLELLNELSKSVPDVKLVVFPEGSNFFKNLSLFGNTLSVSRYFYNLFPSSVLIADNSQIQEDSYLRSKSILLDSKKGIVGSYDKRLLTPNGEYVPYVFRLLLKALGTGSEFLDQVREFKAGERIPSAINLEDGPRVGFLVCSDIFSPEFSRNISLSGGQVIIAQASFGFVNGSKSLIGQTRAAARFRAAENNRPLLYASNYGTSFVISSSGKILKETKNRGFEILTEDIVLNSQKTLYNKIGDWPILLASLSVLISSFFWRENVS